MGLNLGLVEGARLGPKGELALPALSINTSVSGGVASWQLTKGKQ